MPTEYQVGHEPVVQPPLHTNVTDPVKPTHEPDYLIYSIFTMLCCCLPLGIAALVFSLQTRDANHQGNGAEAQRKSRKARIFAHSALGVGIVLIILIVVLNVLANRSK